MSATAKPSELANLPAWLDVGGLLPAEYRRYAPVLARALAFFVGELEPARRARIIAEQLRLGSSSSPQERLVLLLRQCPTLHKLGQVVARDRRLSVELRKRLQHLETHPPSIPLSEIVTLLARELGASQLGNLELAERPLAEASVAVVTPFRLNGDDSEGVLKVLKPGIEETLDEEVRVWSRLGSILDECCAACGLPRIDYRETVEGVVELLRLEVCLDAEQRHLREARARYAPSSEVVVPRLLEPCTSRVTAMERMHGVKITEAKGASVQRQRAGATLLRELLARPFWDPAARAVFHGDPHAGNLLLDPAGRVVLLDWSLTTELDKNARVAIVQIVMGALAHDAIRIRDGLTSLSREPRSMVALEPVVDGALRRVRWGEVPGLGWLTDLLDQALVRGGLTFPASLTVFRKVLLTMSGVLADLSAEPLRDAVLFGSGMQQFASEWPQRITGSMSTRDHGSHVSNQDLLGLLAGAPLTACSVWSSAWKDVVEKWHR